MHLVPHKGTGHLEELCSFILDPLNSFHHTLNLFGCIETVLGWNQLDGGFFDLTVECLHVIKELQEIMHINNVWKQNILLTNIAIAL